MIFRTASLLTLLAVFAGLTGCATRSAPPAVTAANAPEPATATAAAAAAAHKPTLAPSAHAIVGRILAVDRERAFAFVDLAGEPPAGALAAGAELTARTPDLRETARLRASSYTRGKTLGTRILSGQPSPGDEVVWHAP